MELQQDQVDIIVILSMFVSVLTLNRTGFTSYVPKFV